MPDPTPPADARRFGYWAGYLVVVGSMIGAGILGSAGIGYKQDYFAVNKLEQTTEGKATYSRYVAKNDKGEPSCTTIINLDKEGKPLPPKVKIQTTVACEKCGSPMILRDSKRGPVSAK